MKIILYTADQATKLARELTPRLEELVSLHAELRRSDGRLEVLSLTLAGASPANPDAREAAGLAARRTEIARKLRSGVEAIHEQGPVVKDLALGLLDFYSLAGDRLVFLCWKLGEGEVSHWHGLEGGFATRKPLDHSPLED